MFSDIKMIFSRNGFHARVIVLILYFEYKSYVFKIMFKIFRKLICQAIYHFEVQPKVFVDKNALVTLRLPHPYNIIIHNTAKIHENVTIFHEVTIGVVEKGSVNLRKAATIGVGAYIACKSVLLGNIKVGQYSKIGAGSIILKDVSENITVVWLYK